jgi:hypothetical protein
MEQKKRYYCFFNLITRDSQYLDIHFLSTLMKFSELKLVKNRLHTNGTINVLYIKLLVGSRNLIRMDQLLTARKQGLGY